MHPFAILVLVSKYDEIATIQGAERKLCTRPEIMRDEISSALKLEGGVA